MDMAKPIIRFKGYQDDWEQRKAKELCNIGTGKSNTQDQVEDGIYPFYIRSDIPVKSNKYLYDCEAVITIGDGNIGRVFHYVNGKFDLHQRCYKMTDFQDIWGKYFYYFFSTRFYERAMKMTAKATVDSVRLEMISEMDIWKPTAIDEQKKIAEFFTDLDHLITLHQRKCDETKKLKKYMLQKMFPQNGEKVPEIRFSGFTDDWEQRKLGDDLVSIHIGTNLLGSTTNTGMPLIKMGNIQRGYFDTSKLEFLAENEQPDNEDIANYGDFFFNTRNTLELVGKGATWMKNSGEYAFNSNIARFELRNIDTIFFNYLYNTETMTRQIHARAMGTTSVAAIYPRTLESVGYLVPCMKEQQKIGAYFKHLDNLITLHQRELENLQNIKRFMLGKMFV